MKRYLLILTLISVGLTIASGAMAGNITLPTYSPSPIGSYDKLRLIPRATDLGADGTDCLSGLIYVEEGGDFHYCKDGGDGQHGVWSGISGVFTQDGNNIFPRDTLKNPNLRVGIGTSEPQADLHVAGDFLYSGVSLTLDLYDNDAGDDDFIINVDSNTLDIQTNGSGSMTSALTIKSDGNVGIGTSNPLATLHITGNEFITGAELKLKNSAPTLFLEDTDDPDLKVINDGGWLKFQANAVNNKGVWTFGGFDDRLRISAGSEGVWVRDSFRLENRPNPYISFYRSDTDYWRMINNSGTLFNIISKLSANAGAYLYRMSLMAYFAYDGGGILVRRNTEPNNTRIGYDWINFGNTNNNNYIHYTSGLRDHFYDEGTGARLGDDGTWYNGSSRNIKKNIRPLSLGAALQAVKDLEAVTFNYKTDQEPYVGFISEDVPDIVATTHRETLDAIDIIGVLTKVVQDQQKKLNEQQKAFERQNKEIEKIKKRINKIK